MWVGMKGRKGGYVRGEGKEGCDGKGGYIKRVMGNG